jgi:RNA polymerase sigma-70 factor, ECF subfamily
MTETGGEHIAIPKAGRPQAQVSEAWRVNHSYLVDLAFGMLGDIGAAEDAVQEAFARLARVSLDEIEDARGWLTVVTSRICLDQINSARSRRERAQENSTIDLVGPPLAGAPAPMDPADRVTLDDQVGLALLVVLQKLKPAERVVFVLHDIFQVPFETIARTVGRPPATCRQLARRARTKIQSGPKIQSGSGRLGGEVSLRQHRQMAEQFIQACQSGEMSALIEILDPGVWGNIDLGPLDPRDGRGARGRKAVGANLMRYFGPSTTMVSYTIGGHPVVLAFVERSLWAVILLTVEHKLVKRIHVIADPVKVASFNDQLALSV